MERYREIYHQHDVDILDDSRISILIIPKIHLVIIRWDNNIVIYDFETEKYSYYLEKSPKERMSKQPLMGYVKYY